MITFPLELGKVKPGPGFKWMGHTMRVDGLPDGMHTGGVYLSPDETQVWKPLDALPCPNADYRAPTDEAECLYQMSGTPGFLNNQQWQVVELNDRRWLVMPRLRFWAQDQGVLKPPTLEHLLLIERAVLALNAAGWEYNDSPQLAYTPAGEPVLMDFSIAHKPDKWRKGWHGDQYRMNRWWEAMEHPEIAALRSRGMEVLHHVHAPYLFNPARNSEPRWLDGSTCHVHQDPHSGNWFQYVYACTYYPDNLPPWMLCVGADPDLEPFVDTWVCSRMELDNPDLTYAWHRWP